MGKRKMRNLLNFIFILFLTVFFAISHTFAADISVDKIVVEKEARRLTLVSKGQSIRTYKVALGKSPEGPKEKEGDNKTPEGVYNIDARNSKSGYHKSLHISYPNIKDIKHAKELGVSPGGNIMIHGIKNGLGWAGDFHRWLDWTQGCIAVTNKEMDELWDLVPNGTAVEIKP
jgi:murein L,D-transpeptidase YafK